MPSGAVSPAEPVTGLMVAKPPPLPARRRLCSGLSAAYQPDGRRRKIETAAPLTAAQNQLVTTPINQPLQFRPFGPGGGGCSVGATGFQVRRGSGRRGALWFQACVVPDYSESLTVVTNCTTRGPRQRELFWILSGADARGRCERRHLFIPAKCLHEKHLIFMKISY